MRTHFWKIDAPDNNHHTPDPHRHLKHILRIFSTALRAGLTAGRLAKKKNRP